MPRSSKRKFGRETKPRAALMRSLAVALIAHGRITTTEAKAKELRPYIEKLVTKARTPSLATIRLLTSRLPVATASKLMKEVAPKFSARPGGYCRITKLPQRVSDGATMALIEFVS